MEQMKNLYSFLPFVIGLLCAGFACTQDVFMGVTDWLGALSMERYRLRLREADMKQDVVLPPHE